eukprot:gi/632991080/ref/XP_007884463.1/ PREDICTED: keratin, type II cytoskeletal 8-like [Callorhinchus milii]
MSRQGSRQGSSFTSSSSGRLTTRSSPQLPASLLLPPPRLEIDPAVHATRTQEKEQIKGLNNKFVTMIDKVRRLEQQNKVLEMQWDILQQRDIYTSKADNIVAAFSSGLGQQADALSYEKDKLVSDISHTQGLVEEFKDKYEDEINRRTELENDFVLLKKEVDDAYLQRVDLESKVEGLGDEIDFLKQLYDEEVKELQSQIVSMDVTLEVDNTRQLDMEDIVESVKQQHDLIMDRNRKEAETRFKIQCVELERGKAKQSEALLRVKNEIAELTRKIQKLNSEIETQKQRRPSLDSAVEEAGKRGQRETQDARDHVAELEEALRRTRQKMVEEQRTYQQLLNTKMGLDIEIATYNQLLAGEEARQPVSGPNGSRLMQSGPSAGR